jgi:hypothetical protein
MRKLVLALVTVAVLTVGVAWGEGKNGTSDKVCKDSSACCCCSKSCQK